MLIAIISDIHDNVANLEKTLAWCRKNGVAKIICPGDITKLATVAYLAQNFPGEIFVVKGNAELYEPEDLKNFSNISYAGTAGYAALGGLNIGFCHEPRHLKKLIADAPSKLAFVFYGHTHRPDLAERDHIWIANPGYLAAVFSPATFAVLNTETKKLELKILTDL